VTISTILIFKMVDGLPFPNIPGIIIVVRREF
jgi:hypothetical protein